MSIASSAGHMSLKSPSKSVQELAKTAGEQIPETHIYKLPNNVADVHTAIKYMDSSIIDFNFLSAPSISRQELRKFRSIVNDWGCFQLVNHGLSSSLLNQIRGVGKEFFALPSEVKQKYCVTVDQYDGYGGDAVSEDQNFNWNDRLRFKVYPLGQRNYKSWPECIPKFRETLEEYTMEVKRVLEITLKAIAKLLELEENSFLDACGGTEGIYMYSIFNYYPPCSSPSQVIGIKPHSDHSAITVLLQGNEVEGLQVEKDNQWFNVPIVPDSLFIIIADQLEIMSNGLLKSVVHRVVIDKERERTSVAMFYDPRLDKDVEPLSELINNERPQLYRKVKNYGDLYFQYYPKGERSINTVKLQ